MKRELKGSGIEVYADANYVSDAVPMKRELKVLFSPSRCLQPETVSDAVPMKRELKDLLGYKVLGTPHRVSDAVPMKRELKGTLCESEGHRQASFQTLSL